MTIIQNILKIVNDIGEKLQKNTAKSNIINNKKAFRISEKNGIMARTEFFAPW